MQTGKSPICIVDIQISIVTLRLSKLRCVALLLAVLLHFSTHSPGWCGTITHGAPFRLMMAESTAHEGSAPNHHLASPIRIEIIRPPYWGVGGSYAPPETEARIRVSVEDPDDDLAEVRFYESQKLLGALTNAPYTFVWFPEFRYVPTNCSYILRAVAIDRSGLSSTSAPVRFCRGQTEPYWILNEITYPSDGMMFARGAEFEFTSEALITVQGEHIVSTEFYAGTNLLGMIVEPSRTRYPFTITVTNLPAGEHVLKALFLQFGQPGLATPHVKVRIVEAGLRSITIESNGAARLQCVTAYPGSRHEIQGSPDLLQWMRVGAIVPDAHDFDFLDPDASTSRWRYYRLVAFP